MTMINMSDIMMTLVKYNIENQSDILSGEPPNQSPSIRDLFGYDSNMSLICVQMNYHRSLGNIDIYSDDECDAVRMFVTERGNKWFDDYYPGMRLTFEETRERERPHLKMEYIHKFMEIFMRLEARIGTGCDQMERIDANIGSLWYEFAIETGLKARGNKIASEMYMKVIDFLEKNGQIVTTESEFNGTWMYMTYNGRAAI